MTEKEYILAKSQINEEWKQLILNGELQNYDISNTARIRNHSTGKELCSFKSFGSYNMYEHVSILLNDGTKIQPSIHRLVGIMFLPIPDKYLKKGININELVIDHIDNIRCHNIISNLQWLTQQENLIKFYTDPSYIHSINLSKEDIHNICKDLSSGLTIYEISKKYQYAEKSIHDIRYGMKFKKISKKYTFPPIAFNFDSNIIEKIQRLISEGECVYKLSNIFQVDIDTIKQIEDGIDANKVYESFISSKSKLTTNDKKSNETIITICEMLQDGFSPAKISKKMGISKSLIQHIASRESHTDISKDYIFDYDKCKVPDSTVEELCKMIKENSLPLTEIAKKLGVSYSFAKSVKYKKYRTDISVKYF